MTFLELLKIMEKNYSKGSSLTDYEFFMYLIDNCIIEDENNPFLDIQSGTVKRYIRDQEPFNKKRLKQVIKLKDTKRLITFIKKNYSDDRHYHMTCDIQKINPSFNTEESSFEVSCSDLFWELIENLAEEKKPRKSNQKSASSKCNSQPLKALILKQSNTKENNIDRSYYNLFVCNNPYLQEAQYEINETISFEIAKKRIFNFTSTSVKEEFNTLSDNVINQIKQFPSVFANENKDFGSTDESQLFAIGWVKEIKVGKAGIRVSFIIKDFFSQQPLNTTNKLGLDKNGKIEELHREHWSIKTIDLLSVLENLGFNTNNLFS